MLHSEGRRRGRRKAEGEKVEALSPWLTIRLYWTCQLEGMANWAPSQIVEICNFTSAIFTALSANGIYPCSSFPPLCQHISQGNIVTSSWACSVSSRVFNNQPQSAHSSIAKRMRSPHPALLERQKLRGWLGLGLDPNVTNPHYQIHLKAFEHLYWYSDHMLVMY